VYGEKKAAGGAEYRGHVEALAPAVKDLAELEISAQTCYLNLFAMKQWK
jgi:ATP-dependent RNA helicase DDX1